MVRWRCAVVLAMLLLMPVKTGSKLEEDESEEDRRGEESEEDDDEDEEEDEEEGPGGGGGGGGSAIKEERVTVVRRPPMVPTAKTLSVTRTVKKRPLECYVCAYKSETPLRACLDPTKYRVHTITCHSAEDRCFTSVISKGNSYEAVVRGCRSGCVGSPETTCCELNRCNNQAFAMPIIAPRSLTASDVSKANKTIPNTILFFVTVLLVLQTVVKVAFV